MQESRAKKDKKNVENKNCDLLCKEELASAANGVGTAAWRGSGVDVNEGGGGGARGDANMLCGGKGVACGCGGGCARGPCDSGDGPDVVPWCGGNGCVTGE